MSRFEINPDTHEPFLQEPPAVPGRLRLDARDTSEARNTSRDSSPDQAAGMELSFDAGKAADTIGDPER